MWVCVEWEVENVSVCKGRCENGCGVKVCVGKGVWASA